MKRRRFLPWLLYFLWIGVTVVALVVPTERVPRIFWSGLDKVGHTALFTLLGAMGQAATPWLTLLISLPLAVGLELVQKKIPHRTYDPVELIANIVGVTVGVACFELAARLGRR